MKQAKFDALEGVASAASVAALSETIDTLTENVPPITPNTILVDNADGTARESKTFAEVKTLLGSPDFDTLPFVMAWENGVPGDGSDQTAALQALVDGPLVPAEGARIAIKGDVVVSSLDLQGRRNIRFEGMGGRGAGASQRSYLTTNAGNIGSTATVLNCATTVNVSFEKMVIRANNAAFNGRLLSYGLTSPVPGDDSALMAVKDVLLNVNGTGIGLWLYGATLGAFEDVQFGGTGRKVHLQNVAGVSFANQLNFKRCSFIGSNLHPFLGSFEGLHVEDCNFQASPDRKLRAFQTSLNHPFRNLTLINNTYYDALAGGVETNGFYWGEGLTILGNKLSNFNGSIMLALGGGGGSFGDPRLRGLRGVVIKGNTFRTGSGATSAHISFAGTSDAKTNVRGIEIGGNAFVNGAPFGSYGSAEQLVILPNSIYGSGPTAVGSHLFLQGLPVCADRAAAVAAGMTTDQVYIDTGSGRRLLGIV